MKHSTILLVALIAGVLALSGCKPCKDISEATEVQTRIEYRERTVYVPDTIMVTIPAQTAEATVRDSISHLETEYAESDARINADGSLYHCLQNKARENPTPIQRPVEYRDSLIYINVDRTVYQPKYIEKKLSIWEQVRLKTYWAMLVALFASLAWIFREPLMSIIRRFI